MPQTHQITLGGLGGDSHSVGLFVLKRAIAQAGYEVNFLGIQNQIADFFRYGQESAVVMVSCLDGHAAHYLKSFGERRSTIPAGQLWYLGGNLDVVDSDHREARYRQMGFHRVFTSYVDLRSIIELLHQDLHGVPIQMRWPGTERAAPEFCNWSSANLSDDRIPKDSFLRQREDVLLSWRTGPAARDLDDNAAFWAQLPSFARVQRDSRLASRTPLIQPRSGVAGLAEQGQLFKAFGAADVQVVSFQIDSLTRNNNYAGAEELLRSIRDPEAPKLNGFPLINHGVKRVRQLVGALNLPVQTRHSTRDPRLLAELSLASGVSSFEGGAICYNLPYYKSYPLAEAIRNWQYVDRLVGLYTDKYGLVVDREFFGTLTATLIPPCLAIVVNVLEAILAVQQGVRCVSLGYAEQGNRAQDIAAIQVMEEFALRTLAHMGYHGVQVNTVFHQYMAAFPKDARRSRELITQSATTAALAGATRMLSKTPVEATRIPTLQDNLDGIGLCRAGIAAAQHVGVDAEVVAFERAILTREVQDIFDSVVSLGGGSVAVAIVRAFERGFLDIPFSPSVYNAGRVVTVRDERHAVRFLEVGNLQLDADTKALHRSCISGRTQQLDATIRPYAQSLLLENDIMMIPREQYARWPLA